MKHRQALLRPLFRWGLMFAGFFAWGMGVALFVRSGLGLGPWDVFHQGLSRAIGVTIGSASVLTGLSLLLLWIPLRQRPGWATLLNTLCIGPAADFGLSFIPPASFPLAQWGMLAMAMIAVGLGTALYFFPNLGAGPRDGLMLGLNRKFGWSLRWSRTAIETTALLIGYAMGGKIGVGTMVFAFGIGPTVQMSLRLARRWLPQW